MLIKYINKLNVSYFSVHNKCFPLNCRPSLNRFAKCLILGYSSSSLAHNDKTTTSKFIVNNNMVINVKTIANTHKLARKSKVNSNDWEMVNNFDYVCLNLHEDDIALIKPVIDEKLGLLGKERKIKNYKSILKQYDQYISVLGNVIKFGKRYCLIGLNRRLELANFGNVVMSNKAEISRLFYLLLRFKNILNDSEGLRELRDLCPITYDFLILAKANHCYLRFLEFLRDVMTSHKKDSKVAILVVVETHLSVPLTSRMGADFGLKKVDISDLDLLINQARESPTLKLSDNLRNWYRFLGFYLFLPATLGLLVLANLVFFYLYNLRRSRHISISIHSQDTTNSNNNDYDDNNNNNNNNNNGNNEKDFGGKVWDLKPDSGRRNRRIKLGPNARFYDPERD